MLNFTNKKELIITQDLNLYARIGSSLTANKIDFKVTCESGSCGGPGDDVCLYRVFVKKEDYDLAVHLMRKERRVRDWT